MLHESWRRMILVLWIPLSVLACGREAPPSPPASAEKAPSFALRDGGSLRDSCASKQTALLESCGEQKDPEACSARAKVLLEACENLPTQMSSADGAGLFCDGPCQTVPCTAGAPCNLGKDTDGDGQLDVCIAGDRCAPAAEGTVCDAGVLFDCLCTSTFTPRTPFQPVPTCGCACTW